MFAHCGVEGEAKNYDDIFSSYLLLYKEIGESRKKGSFYGQADREGGGAPSALTTCKFEILPFFSSILDSLMIKTHFIS